MPIFPSLYDETLQRLYGQGNLQQQQPMPGVRQPSPIQPLTPQDESTILDKIGGGALSGLGYIGGSLSKAFGGRAIRGLLGGRPEELASIIPFSDTLGITDPSNEVTGSELLGKRDADFLSPEGMGGMAAEVLLDPATYLSLGGSAVSKLGAAAKKVGVLPKTGAARALGLAASSPEADTLARALAGTTNQIGVVTPKQMAEVAGRSLGGHIGVGLPFAGNAATFDLSGVGGALSKALGAVPGGQTVKNIGQGAWDMTQPLRGGLTALFDKSVQGRVDPTEQRIMRELYSNPLKEALVQTRKDVRPLIEEANKAGFLTQAGGRQAGDILEGVVPAGAHQTILDEKNALMQKLLGEQGDALLPVTPMAPQTIPSGPGAGRDLLYNPRQLAQEVYEGGVQRQRSGAAPTLGKAREAEYAPLPRSRIADLAADDMDARMQQAIATGQIQPPQPGSPVKASEAFIRNVIQEDYLGLPPDAVNVRAGLAHSLAQAREQAQSAQRVLTTADEMGARGFLHPQLTQDALAAKQALPQLQATIEQGSKQLEAMDLKLVHAQDLAKAKVEGKVPIFNNPFEDIASKVFNDRDRALKAQAFHAGVVNLAVSQAEAGPGALGFIEALQRGGLAPEGGRLMEQTRKAAEFLGIPQRNLADMWIPKDSLDPWIKWMNGTRTPKGLEPFVKDWDNITNLTKSWQTSPWPGNWLRNFLTDQFMHWINDGSFSSAHMIKDLMDAKTLHAGGVLQDANQIPGLTHLTPQDASMEVHRMLVDHGVMGSGRLLTDAVGLPGEGVRLEDLIPGRVRQGPVEAYKTALTEGTINPFNVRGVGERTESTNKLIKGGQDVNAALSDISRAQTFIGKLRQGFSPEEAMKSVVSAHYDFSQLSDFERQFMKRIIPFYSWMKLNVPTVLQEYAQNPGGKLATVTKASGRARGAEPGFLPPQIGEGVALPIGGEQEGTQRFLTHTGLPFEDLAQMGTSADYLGMLNPLIKAPLELATGKQLFTGRDLRDLHSDTGNTLLDQLIANSPLGRFAGAKRTLEDERKSFLDKLFNIGSGAHLSDVDMQKAKDTAVRNYITDQLRGRPEIGQHLDLYAKKDQLANLTPTEMAMLRLQATRDKEARQRAKIGIRQ